MRGSVVRKKVACDFSPNFLVTVLELSGVSVVARMARFIYSRYSSKPPSCCAVALSSFY